MGPFKLPEESRREDLYLLYDNLQSCLLKYPLLPKAALEFKCIQLGSIFRQLLTLNILSRTQLHNFPVSISKINLLSKMSLLDSFKESSTCDNWLFETITHHTKSANDMLCSCWVLSVKDFFESPYQLCTEKLLGYLFL